MPHFSEKFDDLLVRYLGYFNYKDCVRRINLKGHEKVLEIGSGGGNLSRFLAKNLPYGELVCIDNSKYWIKNSKKRLKKYGNIEFRLEDISKFNSYKNYFDIGIMHFVLHDIENKEKAIENLKEYTKENGKIYIREPARKSHGMPPEEIEKLMYSAGLKELSSGEGYSFPLKGRVYEGVFIKQIFNLTSY